MPKNAWPYESARLILTKRELEIFSYLRQDFSVEKIANLLDIADSTVRGHSRRIHEKLHLQEGSLSANYPSDTPSRSIDNRAQIVQNINILLFALHEALDYEPALGDNCPPPYLWIEGDDFKGDLRRLVQELERLNSVLLNVNVTPARAKPALISIAKTFNAFFESYAAALGKGTAGLTIAAVVALLLQAGIGKEFIAQMLSHWKAP